MLTIICEDCDAEDIMDDIEGLELGMVYNGCDITWNEIKDIK